jgi:hypothetical protein
MVRRVTSRAGRAGIQSRSAARIAAGHTFVQNLRGAHYELAPRRRTTAPARDSIHRARAGASRGGIQVCNQRVQVGMTHARKIVTVEVEQTVFRVLDSTGAVLTLVPAPTPNR